MSEVLIKAVLAQKHVVLEAVELGLDHAGILVLVDNEAASPHLFQIALPHPVTLLIATMYILHKGLSMLSHSLPAPNTTRHIKPLREVVVAGTGDVSGGLRFLILGLVVIDTVFVATVVLLVVFECHGIY